MSQILFKDEDNKEFRTTDICSSECRMKKYKTKSTDIC